VLNHESSFCVTRIQRIFKNLAIATGSIPAVQLTLNGRTLAKSFAGQPWSG
jgi:hypothetical protein